MVLGYRSHESAEAAWDHAEKKTKRYREQKPKPVTEYLSAIQDTPASQIAYVEETGISCCLDREYGWSERGMSLMDVVRGRKFKRTGIVAAKWGRRLSLLYNTMERWSALFSNHGLHRNCCLLWHQTP